MEKVPFPRIFPQHRLRPPKTKRLTRRKMCFRSGLFWDGGTPLRYSSCKVKFDKQGKERLSVLKLGSPVAWQVARSESLASSEGQTEAGALCSMQWLIPRRGARSPQLLVLKCDSISGTPPLRLLVPFVLGQVRYKQGENTVRTALLYPPSTSSLAVNPPR